MSTSDRILSFFSAIKSFFALLGLNFIVLIKSCIEFVKVAFNYYSNTQFLKSDISLILMYLFHNPFAVSKRFLQQKREEDVYAYGETPLTTLEQIAKECHLSSEDRIYELGCGRGRTCFWLKSFIGCKVVGIDYVPEFIERAGRIAKKLAIPGLEFRLENFCETDYAPATVCYLYGTCLTTETIELLIKKFSSMRPGSKIITVSYPLTDYAPDAPFEVMKRFTGTFTWGKADVFMHIVN